MAALLVVAGVVGLVSGPSQGQIALQTAAQQTAAAPDFSFWSSIEVSLPGHRDTALGVRSAGVWDSPGRWRVTNTHDGATSVTTGDGSVMRVLGSGGPALTFELPSDALSAFSNPDSPVLLLPPLGVLDAATHVTRHGDVYDFEVPRLVLANGWVAYAPLTRSPLQLPLIVERDVGAQAVISGGFVTALSFPSGIVTGRRGVTEVASWHISAIGGGVSEAVGGSAPR